MKLHTHFPYGEFAPDDAAFIIHSPEPPKPWTNHCWNQHFLAIVGQDGQGSSMKQDEQGRRFRLLVSRLIHMVDESGVHSIHGLPVGDAPLHFRCIHKPGSTQIITTVRGLTFSWMIFVPPGESCEIWQLNITNPSIQQKREFSIIASGDTALGERQDITSLWASYNPKQEMLKASNVIRHGSWYHHATEGKTEEAFLLSSWPIEQYDCRRQAIYGCYGNARNPQGLLNTEGLTNTPAEFEYVMLSAEHRLQLPPGERITMAWALGNYEDEEQVKRIRALLTKDHGQEALEQTEKSNLELASAISVKSPEKAFNAYMGPWLAHQLRFNATWARIYYNGFRDLCQDNGNLAFLHVQQAMHSMKEVLSHQYANGHAPRAWAEGSLIEQDYADSAVWMIEAVHNIVMEEGREDFLHQFVPFVDSGSGTVLEHCRRAMNHLWNDRGSHGLCCIHGGDWNDMLNGVGTQGRGESVWLSMAFARALRFYTHLLQITHAPELEQEQAETWRQTMLQALESYGWDGRWYCRAFTDSGRPLGSAKEREGRCFLNSQAWAVLCGLENTTRLQEAMDEAEKRLSTPYGYATVAPPYRNYDSQIGYISAVRPGTNTNGGIYVHSNAFKALADCLLQRNDAAWATIEQILPFSEVRLPVQGPPYSIPNSYFAPSSSHRKGDYGGAWITGTAGWLHTVIVNHIFGLQPTMAGLEIHPHLPSHWKTASIRRPFRGAVYSISYQREKQRTTLAVLVDGRPCEGILLPWEKGQEFAVTVLLPFQDSAVKKRTTNNVTAPPSPS